VEFKGPLYNGHAAVVDTSSLAVLSFTISSQIPYAPIAVNLHAGLHPYFIPTLHESPGDDGDDSDNDDPMVEDDNMAFYSGDETDGDDASSADSLEDPVVLAPEERYTYQALTFNLDGERLTRSYWKRLAKVRDLVAKSVFFSFLTISILICSYNTGTCTNELSY
jgi:hypothetical protein